jgi:hypothetical protein
MYLKNVQTGSRTKEDLNQESTRGITRKESDSQKDVDAQRANSAMKFTKEPHQRCAECTPTRCRNGAAEEERR